MKNFVLAGNPNSGKTTLFNSLTGSTAYVGNWPGVTVDKKEGIYKKLAEPINIMDLPGIYSLSPYTPEEIIARNYILNESVDCIINIVDVTNLERNLYLTTQLMEIDVPIIVALNMVDALEKSGESIDVKALEERLGVPCVLISALKESNIDELMKKAYETSKNKRLGKSVLEESPLGHLIKDTTIAFKGIKVAHPLFHAIKLVELDDLEVKDHPQLVDIVSAFKETYYDDTFGNDLEAVIADRRYRYITENLSVLKRRSFNNMDKTIMSKSDKIDRVLTNRFAGIPIFLCILFLIFHLTFSENLFYLGGLFKNVAPCFEGSTFEGLFYTSGGINSPGVMLSNLVVGVTDLLSDLVASLLTSAPSWVEGLIVDGVLGGVFAVFGFLPQILTLFLLFSILEDSGYMARIAFILDKIFRKFGLSGRAFMPMIMGFGCSVPAMINTRTLADEKEKIATLRVIPFFSCGAKLPILTAIAGGICESFGVGNVDTITYSMYVIGMITAIVTILLMRNSTMRGKVPPFIMELPSYHFPQFKSLMIHLWDKAKHFIEKAFTVILASTIVIWVLLHFTWNWTFIDESDPTKIGLLSESIIASIGKFLQPLFTPLGFGSQLSNETGWVFIVAAITGLIAKENVIATFGTLAACLTGTMIDMEGAGADVAATVAMINATGIGVAGLLAFIVFNMTTIPCFAAVATAKGELLPKSFKMTILFWLVTSYIVSVVVYLTVSSVWPIFIFIALLVLTFIFLKLYYNYKDNKNAKSTI